MNPSEQLQQDLGHIEATGNICESILGVHDDLRSNGRHIMDPMHAEGRVLAMKNHLFNWLLKLPADAQDSLVEIAGKLGESKRKRQGNMLNHRNQMYNFDLERKEESRQRRRLNEAITEKRHADRQTQVGQNMFPAIEEVDAMDKDQIKAFLAVWKEKKKSEKIKGPPIFAPGKSDWLGGKPDDLRARLKRVLDLYKNEKPLEWVAEGPNVSDLASELLEASAVEDDSDSSDVESDEGCEGKYAPPVFVDHAYTVSAVLGSHKTLSDMQAPYGINATE